MLPIQKQLTKYNHSPRKENPKYIAIHDVGTVSTAKDNASYFNTGDRQSSADFFVDSNSIFQIIDYHKDYSWAVGDGGGKYGITNGNSVSIEMCLESNRQPSEKTIQNTLDLTRYLMKELNIPISNVIRHFDASKKPCPYSFSNNNWAKWTEFKNRLGNTSVTSPNSTPAPSTQSRVLKLTNPLMYGEDVKKLQQDLVTLGLKLIVDGYYGQECINAVKQFQKLHTWLAVDGIVGESTRKAIKDSVASKNKAKSEEKVANDKLHKVQIGAFKDKSNANKLLKELESKGFKGYIKEE